MGLGQLCRQGPAEPPHHSSCALPSPPTALAVPNRFIFRSLLTPSHCSTQRGAGSTARGG